MGSRALSNLTYTLNEVYFEYYIIMKFNFRRSLMKKENRTYCMHTWRDPETPILTQGYVEIRSSNPKERMLDAGSVGNRDS